MSFPRLALAIPLTVCLAAAPGRAQEEATEEPILGAPAEILEVAGAENHVLIEPGTRLYGRPDVRSPAVALIDAEIELAVLDRRESWIQVRYGAWKGWVAIGGTAADPTRAGRTVPEHVAWRLALAREMLGSTTGHVDAPEERRLGPFSLYTDVEDRRLLRYLSRISDHLAETYRERYGLEPRLEAGDAAVLFAREADYRTYEAQVRPETDRGALGHAAYGLAVLYVGRQGPEDVAAVLVHELTHVLSHRAFAKAPPPWLDEGMANDLAFCRSDGARRLVLGSLGGRSVVIEEHSYQPGGWIDAERAVHLSGPAATRNLLRERWRIGGAIRIGALAELSSGQFFDPEDRQVRYDASAFFVRYLLDGEDGGLAPGFRAFLAALAAGEPGDPSALPFFLERNWPGLELGFAAWLEAD